MLGISKQMNGSERVTSYYTEAGSTYREMHSSEPTSCEPTMTHQQQDTQAAGRLWSWSPATTGSQASLGTLPAMSEDVVPATAPSLFQRRRSGNYPQTEYPTTGGRSSQ